MKDWFVLWVIVFVLALSFSFMFLLITKEKRSPSVQTEIFQQREAFPEVSQEQNEKFLSEVFYASTEKETFPKFIRVEFYPYVVSNGINQRIVIAVSDPQGVKKVEATLIDDTEALVTIPFSKIKEEIDLSEWEGQWTVANVGNLTYYEIKFQAISKGGTIESMSAFFRAKPYEK